MTSNYQTRLGRLEAAHTDRLNAIVFATPLRDGHGATIAYLIVGGGRIDALPGESVDALRLRVAEAARAETIVECNEQDLAVL